jgi:glycerol transport system substrate-binding protein
MRKTLMSATAAMAVVAYAPFAYADMAAAEKWIGEEFTPSTLSVDEQKAEMQWFIDAAAPFAGMEINVLSEGIPTHTYESTVLTKAFEEITGIKVNHQILGEGEVVQAVQTQMQTGRNLYDGYVNDSDLIGTHARLQLAYNLTDQMAGSSPTSTGSARTGSTGPKSRTPSRPNTATISAFRSTGRLTRTSPNSSPTM